MEEKENKLDEIQNTLEDIRKILKPTRWQLLTQGLWRAVGYFIGLLLAIAVISWVLNIIGFIPFMSQFSENMKETLNVAKTR